MKNLTGSEKQIQWAESIRAAFILEIEIIKAKILSDKASKSDPRMSKCLAIIASIKNETDAEWWIDNRNYSAGFIIQNELNKN